MCYLFPDLLPNGKSVADLYKDWINNKPFIKEDFYEKLDEYNPYRKMHKPKMIIIY